ncbi:MAG: putative toxin-antitoxin system toxin component, PIN family [Solirubrobacteraceae bacterium]
MTVSVVADANVLVSGLGWAGPSAQILDGVLDGRLQLIQTAALLAELERVLAYSKLARVFGDPVGTVALIEAVAIVVAPARRIDAIAADQTDNRVLEAAVAGSVAYVISGDRHLLELGSFEGVAILTPAAFCAQVLDGLGA